MTHYPCSMPIKDVPMTQMVSEPEYSRVSQARTSSEGSVIVVLSLAMGSNRGSSQPGVGSQCASRYSNTWGNIMRSALNVHNKTNSLTVFCRFM